MLKKPNIWSALLFSVLLSLVVACGTNNSVTNSPQSVPVVSSGENLYVLDGYTPAGTTSTTNQQIVAFQPGVSNPSKLLTLPAGPTSLNHQRLYTATAKNGHTTITVFNTQTGATIRTLTIPGNYSTTGTYFDTSAVSSNGQWLALREVNPAANVTTIALVDTQTGKLAKIIHLNGNFDLDAVNPDGTRIYLLERLNDGTGHYYVRLYQVDQNQLNPAPIVDKTIPNDIMTGSALTRQMSSDGTIVYTLYIDTAHNIAFVHILPLVGGYLGARCIDLPVGHFSYLLHYYTLALSSDGNRLYAANSALGLVNEISLSGGSYEPFEDQIDATVHFNPGNVNMTASDKTRVLYNGAALSPDQKTLYFAGVHGIWAASTDAVSSRSNSAISANYLTQQAFTSVALSVDGRILYAVDPAKGITLINSSTGQIQRVISGPAQAPWGIEWIAN